MTTESLNKESLSTEPLTTEELRTLFLFERLTPEQLDWIAAHGRVETISKGTAIFREGEPASCFYVLLSGTLRMTRAVRGEEVELNRTGQRGVYCGAIQFFVDGEEDQRYGASAYAVTDSSFFLLPADEFAERFRAWFPMPTHLLEGMLLGSRNTQLVIGQRERLLALGALSAGLNHELNNPAAAAVRATASLRERVAGMRHKLAALARHDIEPGLLEKLIDVQERLVKRVADVPRMSAMQVADREDELTDWLDDHDVADGWDLAPILVPAGIAVADLDEVNDAVGEEFLSAALRWLGYALETETLMGEIEDATSRISNLLGAAKQYSQMDRAAFQWIDVHEGLDSTLVMLAGKIGPDIQVVKDYDRTLPTIPAYAGELNQVWTNLIDNAVAAMDGPDSSATGTLTVTTRAVEDRLLVEIRDTGGGIPVENQERIFEPFFTTKPVGDGTGLGLDIAYRMVVNRHHGVLRVESEPGDTRFQVLLPLTERPEP
ncbi:ATP-binding protein [Actinomadura sp. 9N407]|uniref:ATP-binding protein n=1 Tax=Actinomadura sp. 9N407 TaxID=3375154 RepID=UPI0037BD32EC